MAELDYYVDTDTGNDTTGNGLAWGTAWATLKKAWDYAYLNKGADDLWTIHLRGATVDGAAGGMGYTVPTNAWASRIRLVSEDGCPGYWDTNRYHFVRADEVFTNGTVYAEIVGLQMQCTNSGKRTVYWTGTGQILFDRCLIAGDYICLWLAGSGTVKARNSIIYGTTNCGRGFYLTAGVHYFHNCTIGGAFSVGGIQNNGATAANIHTKNCLFNTADPYDGSFADDDAINDYNAISENNSGEVAIGSHGRYNQVFTFEGAAPDYRITSGDAGAKGYGVDLSGNADLAVTEDIAGNDRSGVEAYDIGAFQVTAPAAGGSAVPLIMQQRRQQARRRRSGLFAIQMPGWIRRESGLLVRA